jgi:hypothetical protein
MVSMLTNARTMRARSTDIHTHTKWGRMAEAVETVLRPIKRVFAGAVAGSSKDVVVRLDELRPQMLVGESPPIVEVTVEESERLNELAAHGPQQR